MPNETAAPVPGEAIPATPVVAARLEAWLAELGVPPGPRVERDGVASWDIALDGRRRRDLRATLILDPGLGLIVWAHLAPPIGDGLRKAFRSLLRWNDEFPLAKFSIADDGCPILSVELPSRWLSRDEVGLALARVAGIADRLFDETRAWVWVGGHMPADYAKAPIRTAALLEAFGPRLPELFEADGERGHDEAVTR
ncbi:MAG: YbjN domain-containing protein [Candidatus Limnocylindrales bacterium]